MFGPVITLLLPLSNETELGTYGSDRSASTSIEVRSGPKIESKQLTHRMPAVHYFKSIIICELGFDVVVPKGHLRQAQELQKCISRKTIASIRKRTQSAAASLLTAFRRIA